MKLYHRTTEHEAARIREARAFPSDPREVFVSTRPDGILSSEGSAVIALNIPAEHLSLEEGYAGEDVFSVMSRHVGQECFLEE